MSKQLSFTRAVRSAVKLRAALQGPSGSGKTYSSLVLATGMARAIGKDSKIALIDSEQDSSAFYADQFVFDSVSLQRKDIDTYVETMRVAARAKYNVLVIDSLSHAWQELVKEVEQIAKARYRGNTWSAWSEGTPKQMLLINAIQNYPGHVISTMRVKTEWTTESAGGGSKSRPVRVGLAPEQRKGMEYEFDLVFELTPDHIASVIKGRIAMMQDRMFPKLTEDVGEELVRWLDSGHTPETSEASSSQLTRGDDEDRVAGGPALQQTQQPQEASEADPPAAQQTAPPTSPGKDAEAFARRLKACTTREDFEAVTGEIEAAELRGEDREFVKGFWLENHARLEAALQQTV